MPVCKANMDIRTAAKSAGLPLWKVAEELGVCEMTMVRWLRAELPDAKKDMVMGAIRNIAVQKD